jgi:hypothetical protein
VASAIDTRMLWRSGESFFKNIVQLRVFVFRQ